VCVVIPARDEAANLGRLLPSLQGSPIVGEVIVVDDASTDATSAVARAHGATVLRLDDDPPAGWTGKAYACSRGARMSTAPLLVFLDADVTLHDGSVERLVAAHEAHRGLVSVQPFHRVEQRHEQLSAACNVVTMIGSGAFAAWPPERRPVAFGPCLVTSRADYEQVGGHASVAGEVVEDIQLARRYAAHGLPVSVFTGADAISFRMYPAGTRQLVEGWTKNLTAGSRLTDPVAVAVAVWWVASCLGLGVGAIDTLIRSGSTTTELALALAGWLAVSVELRWMLRRIGSFRRWTAVLHPIPLWAFVALFGRSAWLTLVRRRVRWSGRRIALAGPGT
jgi:glycosyltransferase involved in cell wall biosynthesis